MMIEENEAEWLMDHVRPELRYIMVIAIINEMDAFGPKLGDALVNLFCCLPCAIAVRPADIRTVDMRQPFIQCERLPAVNTRKVHDHYRSAL